MRLVRQHLAFVGSTPASPRQGRACRGAERHANKQIGRVDVEPGQWIFRALIRNRKNCRSLAQAAGTTPADAAASAADRDATAAAAAAAAATTPAAATPASAATAAAAAAAPATPRHLLQGAAVVFLVEEVERREADVGDFFFAKRDGLRRREVEFLRNVNGGRG